MPESIVYITLSISILAFIGIIVLLIITLRKKENPAAGLSKEQVMEELKRFSDGFFEYLERHDETLEDGTRLINSVELFNELLVFNPHDKSKNTREVWKEYFGIELKDL